MSATITSMSRERRYLIPALQRVQEEHGFLPEDQIELVARHFRMSKNEVFGVASFYALFRFSKPGKHSIRVCLGTACHVRGGPRILEAVEQKLGVKTGETTPDYKFSLERVACFGSCALGPVMVVDKTVYGRMDTNKARKVLDDYK